MNRSHHHRNTYWVSVWSRLPLVSILPMFHWLDQSNLRRSGSSSTSLVVVLQSYITIRQLQPRKKKDRNYVTKTWLQHICCVYMTNISIVKFFSSGRQTSFIVNHKETSNIIQTANITFTLHYIHIHKYSLNYSWLADPNLNFKITFTN